MKWDCICADSVAWGDVDEWDEVGGVGAVAAAALRKALSVVRRRIARNDTGNRL